MTKPNEALPLKNYIKQEHGKNIDFAHANNVDPNQVIQWLKKDCIVFNGKLYSFRRDLNPASKPSKNKKNGADKTKQCKYQIAVIDVHRLTKNYVMAVDAGNNWKQLSDKLRSLYKNNNSIFYGKGSDILEGDKIIFNTQAFESVLSDEQLSLTLKNVKAEYLEHYS